MKTGGHIRKLLKLGMSKPQIAKAMGLPEDAPAATGIIHEHQNNRRVHRAAGLASGANIDCECGGIIAARNAVRRQPRVPAGLLSISFAPGSSSAGATETSGVTGGLSFRIERYELGHSFIVAGLSS